MIDVFGLPPTFFETYFLVLVRVAAVLMTMPVISSRSVPAMAKIGAAAILAFVLTPSLASGSSSVPGPFVLAIAQELLVGLLFGFAVQIVFSGLQMAGQLLGIQMGLNIATTFDPISQTHQVSYIDQLYALLAGMVFLTINGHHSIILALQGSFGIVPLGAFALNEAVANNLVALFGEAFLISVRLGLPVAAALLLTDIAFLIIGRTAPQMNVFFVGQPVKIGVGLIVFFLALPAMIGLMNQVLGGVPTSVTRLFQVMS